MSRYDCMHAKQYRRDERTTRRAKYGELFYSPYFIDQGRVFASHQNRTGNVLTSGTRRYVVQSSGALKRLDQDRVARRASRRKELVR